MFLGVKFLNVGIILLQNKVSTSSSDSPSNSFDISSSLVWFTFFKVVANSSSASESRSFCLRFFALTLLFAATETLLFLIVACPELLGYSENVVYHDHVDDESCYKASGVIIMLLCVSFFCNLSQTNCNGLKHLQDGNGFPAEPDFVISSRFSCTLFKLSRKFFHCFFRNSTKNEKTFIHYFQK